MLNQSLLDDLLCLRRVVVPTARCFSRDSYAGSVITRSTDSPGSVRSQPTASCVNSSNGIGVTAPSGDAPLYDGTPVVSSAARASRTMIREEIDSAGHERFGRLPAPAFESAAPRAYRTGP